MAQARRRVLPTREQLRVWRDYIETAEVLRSLIGSRLQADSGLSSADYAVLLALSEADGRTLRSSELAELIGWERSRLSHHLGRMEKRELIHRSACAGDSRGAEVALSEAGATAFRSSSVPHLRAIREIFIDAFSPEQLAQIDTLTTTLREHLDRDARD
ncbi:MarR family winged helix-turn-helix transcriptional regulator [Streptomyces shenzhenensis]|uniref:MarR family transcriptional regulator n=1 Tax=Streptomyces shenzhenensis TaxID=943815 RepID=A0A3M0HYJ7_9ACTN|nr:MarR family transcriptional regulator [Streptomyces shenzhenensis]RMB82321.1 MarR family transcriptional regulator [Streptomyces shenzhenensis]